MDRNAINPWTWQDQFGFAQANDLNGVKRVLVCSGQTSVDDEGNLVHAGDMAGQLNKALDNLETVLGQAGAWPIGRSAPKLLRNRRGCLFGGIRNRHVATPGAIRLSACYHIAGDCRAVPS